MDGSRGTAAATQVVSCASFAVPYCAVPHPRGCLRWLNNYCAIKGPLAIRLLHVRFILVATRLGICISETGVKIRSTSALKNALRSPCGSICRWQHPKMKVRRGETASQAPSPPLVDRLVGRKEFGFFTVSPRSSSK
ncbi:hypothetical protein MAPG_05079 [Magnaporthiopsis poae ATCC 64411]|uniref:Uncharacterized protein n=1 Tax=Magnaporthiopsis poae (strain ATCC 64411 / 73-15) TaxID=644358 RepID=A0A0C4DYF8_MAGP6|nr:hypothetical protein MAPG_05079 [Magnaporthiopsis poae ATCC 64411]